MTQAVHRVGVTRSGKEVQVPIFSDEPKPELPAGCASYTLGDHFDAYSIFEYLLSRELRRRPADTAVMNTYQSISTGHNSRLDQDWHQTERAALGLATIFDVLQHGKGLADGIFQD